MGQSRAVYGARPARAWAAAGSGTLTFSGDQPADVRARAGRLSGDLVLFARRGPSDRGAWRPDIFRTALHVGAHESDSGGRARALSERQALALRRRDQRHDCRAW